MPHLHFTFMGLFESVKETWSSELPHGSKPLFVRLIFFSSELLHKYEVERAFFFLCYSIIQSWHGYWFPSPNNNTEWLGLDSFGGSRELVIIARRGFFIYLFLFSLEYTEFWQPLINTKCSNASFFLFFFFSCGSTWTKQAIHVSYSMFWTKLSWFVSKQEVLYLPYTGTCSSN